MTQTHVIVYLVRRDLRVGDNPILHYLATTEGHGFTHLLPVYVFPASQVEISGFVPKGEEAKNPYPPAKSSLGGYWRCGPHRVQFLAESVWGMKDGLQKLGSGLLVRVGMLEHVSMKLVKDVEARGCRVSAFWMTAEEGVEEKHDEKAVASMCRQLGIDFKLWADEKYYIDDRDLGMTPEEVPDVFTTFRKSVEPLRAKPRRALPPPGKFLLPKFLELSELADPRNAPGQVYPFFITATLDELKEALLEPVRNCLLDIPPTIEMGQSVGNARYPLMGGEMMALERLRGLVQTGLIAKYEETRNGLIGDDFSTKLSPYLAQGCITARQIHAVLVSYEDATDRSFEDAPGYGNGENDGAKALRFELLWRDYMHLCARKFKRKLFRLRGFRDDGVSNTDGGDINNDNNNRGENESVARMVQRFNAGTTGLGLIDASQRELLYTGYTSGRARQNVANFLAKHLGLDWRLGAEWYEMMLVDYDMASNWANWQYLAGVGNDPRGEARLFNPVKQAFAYDQDGAFVRAWIPEIRGITRLENLFQVSTTPPDELAHLGLTDNIMVTDPLKRIEYTLEAPKPPRRGRRGHKRRSENTSAAETSDKHNVGSHGGSYGGSSTENNVGDQGGHGRDRGGGGRGSGGRGGSWRRGRGNVDVHSGRSQRGGRGRGRGHGGREGQGDGGSNSELPPPIASPVEEEAQDQSPKPQIRIQTPVHGSQQRASSEPRRWS